MAILSISTDVTGQEGLIPQEIYIKTNDTLATVIGAGYLNQARQQGFVFADTQIAHVYGSDFNNGAAGCLDFQVSVPTNPLTGNFSLVNMSNSGEVDLPVTANHIATFVGTTGTIGDDAATAINGGNIQAGLSGTAGYLASFPATSSKGSLHVSAVANTGNTVTTISNAAMGQASVISIPDPAGATGNFAVAPAALVNGNLIQASGTSGLISDAGVAPAALQLKANIKAAQSPDIGGGGAGPIDVTVASLTSASVVVANIVSSTNAVTIDKVLPGTGKFSVTFSADPGAACVLSYVAFVSAQ